MDIQANQHHKKQQDLSLVLWERKSLTYVSPLDNEEHVLLHPCDVDKDRQQIG